MKRVSGGPKTRRVAFLATCLLLLSCLEPGVADARTQTGYREDVGKLVALRGLAPGLDDPALERALISGMKSLFGHWYGTRWGLGAPQTKVPGQGKINCGMFVGRTLVDAGFVVNHHKLQRQPAELIIRSLVPKRSIKRFRFAPMATFLDGVRRMGPGLFIIGLDFHVGYLLVKPDGEVRFIHASYVTHTVINEPARGAVPIETSKYRVVGKLFSGHLLEKWRAQRSIRVLGHW